MPTVTTPQPPRLLTPAEAAERLGIAERTVRDLARAGHLGYVRVGGPIRGPVRFSEEQLADYIARQSQRGISPEARRAAQSVVRHRRDLAGKHRTAADVVAARVEAEA